MSDEHGSVFQPINQSDMIARIESFDHDDADQSYLTPEPASFVAAPVVEAAPAPAPVAQVAPAPAPVAEVAPTPAPVAAVAATTVEPDVIVDPAPVFRPEDPALAHRTRFILGGPEAAAGQ